MVLPEPLYVLVQFVINFLDVLLIAMLIRAIVSWFFEGDNKFIRFVFVLTEPTIIPFRKLFYKMNWFQETPVDAAFGFSMIGMLLIQMLLTAMV